MIQWYNILQKGRYRLNFDEVKAEGEKNKDLPSENAHKPQHLHQKQAAPKKPSTKGVAVQKQTVRKTGAA